jgi:4-hydroxy-tetrahydrodipicolinate synthase
MNQTLQGVLPVLHMPYHDNETIDFETLGREIDFAFGCGADGIVFALASELLRLTTEERRAMAEFLVAKNGGRGSVTISIGAESTPAVVEFATHAQSAGADALMAIPPLATAAGESELKKYFGAILDATQIPLVVQDASGYVGLPMSAQFQAALYEEFGERVLFKPEAAPVGPVISALHELTNHRAQIFEGSGGSMLIENFRRGLAGTMPGVDLLDAIIALWRALQADDDARIYAISPLVSSILAMAVNLDGFLAIEKHLMHKRGIFKNTLVRGPVAFELDEHARAEVDRLFDRLQDAIKL